MLPCFYEMSKAPSPVTLTRSHSRQLVPGIFLDFMSRIPFLVLALLCAPLACSPDPGGPIGASGGESSSETGGAPGHEGPPQTGGSSPGADGGSGNAAGGTVETGSGGASVGGNSAGGTSAGGTTADGGSSASGGTLSTEPMPRTACPEPPPAEQKAPSGDRALAVSKNAYSALIKKETPFMGSRGSLPYHLYEPSGAEKPSAGFPLLLVLHGGYGREVTDGNIMVDVAQYLLGSKNGLLTEANRAALPTYILLPHCRENEGCTFGSNEWSSAGGAHYQVQPQPSVAGGTALELLEHVIKNYPIDPTRVYLTGNSMGGGGTWEFASRRPELFAAILPVSGHPPADQFLAPIAEAKLPVWAFGAQNDYTNPYTDTVSAIDLLSSQNGCAWLTTYTGAGHDDALWSSPYLEPGLWPWLFAQTNPSAPR